MLRDDLAVLGSIQIGLTVEKIFVPWLGGDRDTGIELDAFTRCDG